MLERGLNYEFHTQPLAVQEFPPDHPIYTEIPLMIVNGGGLSNFHLFYPVDGSDIDLLGLGAMINVLDPADSYRILKWDSTALENEQWYSGGSV